MAVPDNAALVVCVIFFTLATALICTRMYLRTVRLHNAGIDDVLCCIAGVFNVGVTICLVMKIEYGYRAASWTENWNESRMAAFAYYLSMPLYQCALGCIKASIIFQYRRIFIDKLRRACLIVLVAVICNTTAFFFIMTFRCSPFDGLWMNRPTVCLDAKIINYVFVPINFSTDIILLLLPLPIIRNLNLGKAEKRGLMFIFGLGGFAALTSILRLQYVITLRPNSDHAFNHNGLLMWCCIEISVSTICACLPSLNGIFARLFPRVWGKHSSYGSRRSGRSPRQMCDMPHGGIRKGDESTDAELSDESKTRVSEIQVTTTVEQSVVNIEKERGQIKAGVNHGKLGLFWEPTCEGPTERQEWYKNTTRSDESSEETSESQDGSLRLSAASSDCERELIPGSMV